ncbi:hypothetical protein BGZ65_003024 [Modicella reniformis]|uniref:Uncharacterized protein n=1 Tax=Modicella reniformis TaxID=1440133 RepID=A0A9P6SU52_9FUNG|nr:hypothetical protein BGZ65_003024 [Modicella reniformis]
MAQSEAEGSSTRNAEQYKSLHDEDVTLAGSQPDRDKTASVSENQALNDVPTMLVVENDDGDSVEIGSQGIPTKEDLLKFLGDYNDRLVKKSNTMGLLVVFTSKAKRTSSEQPTGMKRSKPKISLNMTHKITIEWNPAIPEHDALHRIFKEENILVMDDSNEIDYAKAKKRVFKSALILDLDVFKILPEDRMKEASKHMKSVGAFREQ